MSSFRISSRYDLRFDENIGVGEIEQVQSYLDEQELRPANQKRLIAS